MVVPDGETGVMPYPSLTNALHHEIELVVAIGLGGTHIRSADAHRHVFGYAVGLDMTRRDLQNAMKIQGRPWCIGKAFDHSAPIGPITPVTAAGDITQAVIDLHVNGQRRQHSHVHRMIWTIAEMIEHFSTAWTLKAGDLLYTGTPAGVATVVPGDLLVGRVTGLSDLRLRISEPTSARPAADG